MQEENIEKRERILNSAKSEFAEKGFDGARMGAIARRADVNQALIHYYFNNKGNLYSEVLRQSFGINHGEAIGSMIGQWGLTPSEQLYILIYFLVHIHLEASDPDFNRIIAREVAERRDNVKSMVSEYMVPRLTALEEVIIRGQETGEFETGNSLMLVIQLIVFIIGFESNREIFQEVPGFRRLYGADSKDMLFKFILEHTFKGLCPRGKEPSIPEIPQHIIEAIDGLISEIRQKRSPVPVK